jgi:hypothetical protein
MVGNMLYTLFEDMEYHYSDGKYPKGELDRVVEHIRHQHRSLNQLSELSLLRNYCLGVQSGKIQMDDLQGEIIKKHLGIDVHTLNLSEKRENIGSPVTVTAPFSPNQHDMDTSIDDDSSTLKKGP